MTSETDEIASTFTYKLTCDDCAFETTVKGTVYDALDVAKTHREKNEDPGHFVEFELAED